MISGMNRRSAFCLMIVTVWCLCGSAQELKKQGNGYVYQHTQMFNVGKEGSLNIRGISGDVTIRSWDKSTVEILERTRLDVFTEEEAREILERTQSGYSHEDNRIYLEGNHQRQWVRQQFEIMLPVGFTVEARMSQGNLTVDGVGRGVEARSAQGNITLLNITGDISVKTSAGNLELKRINGTVTAKTSAGNMILEEIRGAATASTSGGNIYVTGTSSDLIVKTSGGNIEIQDVGGNLIATTSGGSIELDNCRGTAELKTSGGNIRITKTRAAVDAITYGGDIVGEDLEGILSVETNGGDIELRDLRGGARAATAAGDIEVEITSTNFKSDHRTRLRTSSGDIQLTIPGNMPAMLLAEINGNSRWNRFGIYSDFPMTQEAVEESRGMRSTGKINGGGDEVILETSNGNIYIRKAK